MNEFLDNSKLCYLELQLCVSYNYAIFSSHHLKNDMAERYLERQFQVELNLNYLLNTTFCPPLRYFT